MSETHNTVIVGNKMFRYRKEQHLATDPPLDRHELSVNELSRQLAEARKEKKKIMRWMKKYLDKPNGCRSIGFSDLYEMYEQLKEKGDEFNRQN